jgi:hypothetical protein
MSDEQHRKQIEKIFNIAIEKTEKNTAQAEDAQNQLKAAIDKAKKLIAEKEKSEISEAAAPPTNSPRRN